jgi:hypothetical protein
MYDTKLDLRVEETTIGGKPYGKLDVEETLKANALPQNAKTVAKFQKMFDDYFNLPKGNTDVALKNAASHNQMSMTCEASLQRLKDPNCI